MCGTRTNTGSTRARSTTCSSIRTQHAAEVYIENTATALLYIYTPYQPNLAALEAGAGEGDACSTYGNRNFSIIYSGWFGDPRA